METGKAVEAFEKRVVEAINASGLHPVVVRLVLLNLLHAVEEEQRRLEKEEAESHG